MYPHSKFVQPFFVSQKQKLLIGHIAGLAMDCKRNIAGVKWVGIISGTAERTVIGRNGTLILTLCLTLPDPNQITVIYAVQLPNVFPKLIVTFRRVPWIILF